MVSKPSLPALRDTSFNPKTSGTVPTASLYIVLYKFRMLCDLISFTHTYSAFSLRNGRCRSEWKFTIGQSTAHVVGVLKIQVGSRDIYYRNKC